MSDNNKKLESKKTALLITYKGRTARGTVRYSEAGGLGPDELAVPADVARKLKLLLSPNKSVSEKVSVRTARRFVVENLWNNGDPSIKYGFRTAIYIGAATTVIAIAVPLFLEHWLKL